MSTRPKVFNIKTGQEITDAVEASPLLAQDGTFDFGDRRYWFAWVPQHIRDVDMEAIEADEQRRRAPVMELPKVKAYLAENGAETEFKYSDLINIVIGDPQAIELVTEMGKAAPKPLRVKAFAGSIIEWNVTDLQGVDLPLGVEAFEREGGVYDAALLAVEQAFLFFKNQTPVAPATETTSPLLLGGAILSTAPETSSTTPVTDTFLATQSTSNSQKTSPASPPKAPSILPPESGSSDS